MRELWFHNFATAAYQEYQKHKQDGTTGDPVKLMALQNGVDVKTVSSMLGHYSAGFTLDTYAHVTTDAQLKAAQTMGNILSRAV